eukprot:TRINITY_DN42389_c0_g1_i1.p1 TRINITY_DN42389_c0_g1~~TRINITY_DN42389_c0_g1_i1.p1  ORF type:complete len:435 (+),score=128.58 TRINITY_DN42389_c0_g1_i1:71-1375(+)
MAGGSRGPATRNLTNSFLQCRADRKKRAGGSGYEQVPGISDVEAQFAGGDSKFKRQELPPEWVDIAGEAEDDIRAIRDLLKQLTKAQQRRLLSVFADADADREVEVWSSQLTGKIKHCEGCIHKIKRAGVGAGGVGVTDDEFRVNMQRKLAAQLTDLSKQSRETQRSYLDEMRKRQGGGAAAADSSGGAGAGGAGGSGGVGGLMQQELENMEDFAANRTSGIARIAASVNELHSMFKDVSTMVIDQGTVLDRIDYNMEQLVEKGQKTNAHLQKTQKNKKAHDERSMKCIALLVLINVVLLFILLLKYKIKFGWSFGGMLMFMLFLLASAAASFSIVRYRPSLCHRLFPRASSWFLPKHTNPYADAEGDGKAGKLSRIGASAKNAFAGGLGRVAGGSQMGQAASAAQSMGVSGGMVMQGLSAGRQGFAAANSAFR